MKLSKDNTQLVYNEFLTLDGIPAKAFKYRLGNRSALEWVIDQYCVKTDKRSGIINDPNRADDPQYILKLIKKVLTVSLETVEIIERLSRFEIFSQKKNLTRSKRSKVSRRKRQVENGTLIYSSESPLSYADAFVTRGLSPKYQNVSKQVRNIGLKLA